MLTCISLDSIIFDPVTCISQIYYVFVSFLIAPISPTSNDWLWSNATHIYIQLSGWDDGGCDVNKWDVEYKLLGSNTWLRAENRAVSNEEDYYSTNLVIGLALFRTCPVFKFLVTAKTILMTFFKSYQH